MLKIAKQEKFARNVSNIHSFESLTDAYQRAYKCTRKSAESGASALMNSEKVKGRISELMDLQGMNIASLNEQLAKLTKAKKEVLTSNGEIIELNDNSTRLSALKTGLKLHGFLNGGGVNINIDQREQSVNVSSNPGEVRELTHTLTKFETLNKKVKADNYREVGEVIAEDNQFIDVKAL